MTAHHDDCMYSDRKKVRFWHHIARDWEPKPPTIELLSIFRLDPQAADLKVQTTTAPKPMPDMKNLKFGHNFSDHMLVVPWKNGEGWGHPVIKPLENFSLHPACKVFHYANEVSAESVLNIAILKLRIVEDLAILHFSSSRAWRLIVGRTVACACFGPTWIWSEWRNLQFELPCRWACLDFKFWIPKWRFHFQFCIQRAKCGKQESWKAILSSKNLCSKNVIG